MRNLALLVTTAIMLGAGPDPKAFEGRHGKTVSELLPPSWKVADDGEKRADLNGDAKPDLALVVETKAAPVQRALAFFFADDKGDYRFAALGAKAVLGPEDGGVFGDPFAGFDVSKKRVVTVSFYGGSNLRWAATYKWRYDDGSFRLIGSTHEAFHTSEPEDKKVVVDTNYLTGRYDVVTKRKKPKAVKGAKLAKTPRITLESFEAGETTTAEPHVQKIMEEIDW